MSCSLLRVATILVGIITVAHCVPTTWLKETGNNVTAAASEATCSKNKCKTATAKGGGKECCSGCCIDDGKHIHPRFSCSAQGTCPGVCRKEGESCKDRDECCTENTFTPPGCCKGADCSKCKGATYSFVHNCLNNKCLKCSGIGGSCDAPGGCCGGKDYCCGASKGNKCGIPDGAGLGTALPDRPDTICPTGTNPQCCSGVWHSCGPYDPSNPVVHYCCGPDNSTLSTGGLDLSREELEAAFMKKWGHIVTIAEVKPLDREFPPEPPSCIAELKKVCGQCFKGASPDMGCLEKCGPMHIPELVKAGCKKPQPAEQPGRSLLQAANPFAGLTNAISSITGAWSSIVSAFKSSYSQQLEYEQLGRGWSKFKESTKVFKGAGLEYAKAPEFFKDIRTMIAIPPKYNSQFDQILQWIQFFDSEYWSEHDTTWSIGKSGTNTHFTMFANNNQNTSKIDVVFLTIAEEFKLAPDIFVISESHSSFGGLFSSTTLKFKKKPGAMTDEELTFVSQFFMLQAYQEIALAMNLPQPGGGADPVGPPPPPALP